MKTREEVKDELRNLGITNPTMRMVRRVTRQYVNVIGVDKISREWQWKYHPPTLLEALRHAVEEIGPSYEAVRVAERAFHDARSTKQVFDNLDVLIRKRLALAA